MISGIRDFFYHSGRYFLLLQKVFRKPERMSVYRKLIINEINLMGVGSLGIISIISVFMGAVLTIQTANGIMSAWVPTYLIGFTTREGIVLEFSSTMVSLILAGKVGSSIASEIGSMRVSEQIDALEMMGVNSAGYLILPKIVASMIFNPILMLVSMFLGIMGGWAIGVQLGVVSTEQFIYGVRYAFRPFGITYAFIKMVVFAFIISSVSAYNSYYIKGSSLEVGQASTRAVVYSSITILVFNFLLTQLLLG